MAPVRKMTQKEIKLERTPWMITRELLVSTGVLDKLWKRSKTEKDPQIKDEILVLNATVEATKNQT